MNSARKFLKLSSSLLIVLAVILPLQTAQAIIRLSTENAIWVFADPAQPAIDPISNPAARQALIAHSAASNVNIIYLSVYRSAPSSSGRQMYEDLDMADLITQAHAKGIKVYAAYGNPDWPSFGCDANGFPLRRLAEVISYNTADYSATVGGYPYSGKFDGVMLDIEPPAPPATMIMPADFVALLTQYQCFKQQAQANGLKLSVAIRFGWKEVVTYNGLPQEFYKHVVDMIPDGDHVVVMGYRDFAGTTNPVSDGVIASDQDQIAYAGSVNKNRLILAGLETSDPASTGISNRETLFEEGQSVLNGVAQVVFNHFGFFSGLGGFAIHNYGNGYLGGISAKWPSTNTDFPTADNNVEELATPAGSPVTVSPVTTINSASVSISFPTIGAAGYTYASPINSGDVGTLPSNYLLSVGLAFDIATTAAFTGPVTVCFRNLDIAAAMFPTLRVLHKTAMGFIDETVLSGANAPDPATKSICAMVNSFSPFVLANLSDSSPPVISNVSATPAVIWPPNQKMVDVTIGYSVSDDSALPANPSRIISISSNEPISQADAVIVDAHHVRLRAERLGQENGRTYTITVKATDRAGNSSTQSVRVMVPHDQGSGKDK
jgi:hypothetical protein